MNHLAIRHGIARVTLQATLLLAPSCKPQLYTPSTISPTACTASSPTHPPSYNPPINSEPTISHNIPLHQTAILGVA